MALISKIKNTADSVDYNIRDDVHTWGGRNLMLHTDYATYGTSTFFNDGIPSVSINNNKMTIPYATSIAHLSKKNVLSFTIPSNTIVTCSVYVYENTIADGTHAVRVGRIANIEGTSVSFSDWQTIPTGFTGLYSWQWKFSSTTDAYGFILNFSTTQSTSGNMILGRVKVEIGNKPTDWSPAPEDIAYVNGTTLELLS